METISVPMNAVRVCNAIARIGYEPHSALMDIVDNAVAADSFNIGIYIELVEGKTINQRNNVALYRVVDDGKGMDEDGIKNAFKLGSDENYKPNSLSKYGMGLKSAGFSLGSRIQIVSKKSGVLTRKFYIDRKVIEEINDYVICCESLVEDEKEKYEELLSLKSSGTIVEITGCGEIYHTSAKTTIGKLKHKLGVTYYPFLAAPEGERLNIKLIFPGEGDHQVMPEDILFAEDAKAKFDLTNYTGSNPCYAFRDQWRVHSVGEGPEEVTPIKLNVVTFPKDAMAGPSSPLNDEERAKVRTYKISRENKGFFVYRNGRLIRWGDDLDMIGKDLIGFRARMELTSDHDDILHVDVSKQRLEIDDETRNNLEILMRLPKKQAKNIFEICDSLLKKGTSEGVGFTETADSVPEEDPVEDASPPDPDERKQRSKMKGEKSKEILEKIVKEEQATEEGVPPSADDDFLRVRYSDTLPSMSLWSSQKDLIQGAYVIINRRHAFYQSVISNFDESSPERLAIEALIFCCAIGENTTFENLTSVNDENIIKVFNRFHTILSYNLGEWAGGNQHIFE